MQDLDEDDDSPPIEPNRPGKPDKRRPNSTLTDRAREIQTADKPYNPIVRINLKRLRETQALDELLEPSNKRIRTSISD